MPKDSYILPADNKGKMSTHKKLLSTKTVKSPDHKEIKNQRNLRTAEIENLESKPGVNINNSVPAEILYLIFRQLIPLVTFPHPVYKPADWQHLKRTRQVCQLWREVGEAPGLWQKTRLQVTSKNLSTMPRFLGTWRMRDVQNIHISEKGAVSEELLKAVAVHRGLREMTLSCSDLFSVPADLLARVVLGLEEVWMTDTQLDRPQVEAIFEGLTGQTKLKALTILNADLTSVDPGLLARAVGGLELVELPRGRAQLTDEQAEAIYKAVASGKTRVKRLGVRLCSLELELVAVAVNNLEYWGAELDSLAAEAVLASSLEKTSLKKLLIEIKGPIRVDKDLVIEAHKVIKGLVVIHMEYN